MRAIVERPSPQRSERTRNDSSFPPPTGTPGSPKTRAFRRLAQFVPLLPSRSAGMSATCAAGPTAPSTVTTDYTRPSTGSRSAYRSHRRVTTGSS